MVRLRDLHPRRLVDAGLACGRGMGLLASVALKYVILYPKWLLRITLLLGVLWFGLRQHSIHGMFSMLPTSSSVFSFSDSDYGGRSAARPVDTTPPWELVLGKGHHFPILLERSTLLKAQLRLAGHMLEQQWQQQRGNSRSSPEHTISHTNVAVLLDQLALQADEVKFAHHMGLHHDRQAAQRGECAHVCMGVYGFVGVWVSKRMPSFSPLLPPPPLLPLTPNPAFSAGASR